jgi:phospholipid/cholesterol/gamma-HCH transport system ATP-binding protein
MKHRGLTETYSLAVFSLDSLDALIAVLGHEAAQEAIRCMGAYIDKHFSVMGGFSTRRNTNEFVTVLPYSTLNEARDILRDFLEDFREHGVRTIWAGASKLAAPGECVEFAIRAGLAQGQPITDIDAVIASAENDLKEIGRMRCTAEEPST